MKPFIPSTVYSSLFKTKSNNGMNAFMLQGDASTLEEYDHIPNSIPQNVE